MGHLAPFCFIYMISHKSHPVIVRRVFLYLYAFGAYLRYLQRLFANGQVVAKVIAGLSGCDIGGKLQRAAAVGARCDFITL